MKKYVAILLLVALIISISACNKIDQNYRKVNFNHPDILSEELILTIPSQWSTEEICKDNALLEIYNDSSQIGNITINENYEGNINIYESKEKLVPVNGGKFIKINDKCFITTDKGKGYIISYLIANKVIDIFLNILIEKNTIITIAKNLDFKSFKKTQTPKVSEDTPSKTTDIVIDIAYLDNENSIYQPKTYNQAYSVFLSINSLAEIMKKPGANSIGASPGFRSMSLTIEVDDGFSYYVIEDYLLKALIFAKSEQPTNQANSNNYIIINRKPFSSDTNLINTWDAFVMRNGLNKSMVTIEIIEKMIEAANLYSFISNGTIHPDAYEVSDNKVAITVKLYCPTLKAYFHVTENYETKQAYFGLSRINNEDNIPKEYWKYNVSRTLSSKARKSNFKTIGGLF